MENSARVWNWLSGNLPVLKQPEFSTLDYQRGVRRKGKDLSSSSFLTCPFLCVYAGDEKKQVKGFKLERNMSVEVWRLHGKT
ncbi:hypothetical protein COLO4_13202 [Corchorus olitorius]|uniref:Uncharacterized protein n=1 Tax=Corchorus olitorius TaxID=93759 RepID=A0A1R3JXK9_9ROSI|nr:hypothetical protein COLO4_13202 [Corchorus olitorius]